MLKIFENRAARLTGIGVLGALLVTPILAQQRERLPRECMREIRQLCGTDRSQIRSCLRERYSELSENCAGELRDRMQQRRGSGAREGRGVEASAAQYTRVSRAVIFGDDSRQQVDLYEPREVVEATPLILFIHGGGWTAGDRAQSVQAKPAWFNAQGYYFGEPMSARSVIDALGGSPLLTRQNEGKSGSLLSRQSGWRKSRWLCRIEPA